MILSEYLPVFEEKVILGLCQGLWNNRRYVSIRPGKLNKTRLSNVLGQVINTDIPVVIDYYGYLKKSVGFFNEAKQLANRYKGRQLKLIEVPIIFFASIKMEDITLLTDNYTEIGQFIELKQTIINLRGFKNKRGDNRCQSYP